MDLSIDIDLNPDLKEILNNIGESDNVTENLTVILKEFIFIKLEKINKIILEIQEENLRSANISKELMDLSNYPNEKLLLIQEKLLKTLEKLKKFEKQELTEEDYLEIIENFENESEADDIDLFDIHNEDKAQQYKDMKKLESKSIQIYNRKKIAELTTNRILEALNSSELLNMKDLIFKLKIRDMLDARFIQVKLKELERKGLVESKIKMGKKYWRKTK